MFDDERNDDAAAEAPTIDQRGRSAPAAPASPPLGIGGFRILRKLGEGGMGIVYEAEQQNPKRLVALKVVRGGRFLDDSSLRLFRRETETLARLAHPNIGAIYETGRTDDGLHFFTMELVAGRTLGAYVRERLGGSHPTAAQLRERLRLFATVCRAVNYAHQRGVIHRDLKPSNLVVAESGDVKVLDFGLARITDPEGAAATVVTEAGTIVGTLPYMSPEQARGDSNEIDVRTDVYALGVILFELLTAQQPYETSTNSIVSSIKVICETPPRSLRAAAPDVPIDTDLQTVVTKALEKEPDRRYQSAGALADDVERYLADQPILAHPPSTTYQVRKWVTRHRGRVAALGAIAALLVALAVTMVVQAQRVRQERDRATAEAAKAEAINRFLIDALGGADPWNRGSRSVTLVDALAQAQANAHASFRNQPLVEAAVLQTIGTTFGSLAEFGRADTALRAAIALTTAAAGRRSADGADALNALAAMDLLRDRYAEAESLARESADIMRVVHGPSAPRTAMALENLATALANEARYAEAKSIAEQLLTYARARRAAGATPTSADDDPTRLEIYALAVLGRIASDQGDAKEDEALSRQHVTLARGRGNTADLAQALSGLGIAQMNLGNLAGAESTLTEAVGIARAAMGEVNPLVAVCRENLGNVYFRQGKLDQTLQCLAAVLAIRRQALGDDSEPVARTLANMATVYRKAGHLAESERSYREAIPRLERALGPGHPDVGATRSGLGEALRRERKFAEAETQLRRALAIQVHALGDAHASTQRTLQFLRDLYKDLGQPAQAAAYAARITPAK